MCRSDPVRVAAVLTSLMIPFLPGAAVAQGEPPSPMYVNCQYGFAIIFPGASKQPMTRDIRYTIPFYADNLPARQFYLEQGGNTYTVTIVDFSSGPRSDERIVEQAAAELRKKGEVRFQAYADYDPAMPGRQLNIFQPNNRQIRASIYMAYNKLTITEAEATVGDTDALVFEQSITLVDREGNDLDRVNAQDENGKAPRERFSCT